MTRIEQELQQLNGATIIGVALCGQTESDHGTPMLIVRTTSGAVLQVEAWMDPEGNGGGYLSIGLPELAPDTPASTRRA